ncbi:MAG TPA: Crp/Fnr family transcriptional regulator [Candidatus Olsenella pullicola]|nr:Crp/Fnr family transcriptional regulator [Candidatus Olsenella pullicola]
MNLETFFVEVVGVSDANLAHVLAEAASETALKKGDRPLTRGEVPTTVHFLASGVARSFSFDADGHEVTDCIVWRPGSVLAPTPELGDPSIATVEMLTDGTVVSVGLPLIARLLETSLPANHLYIRLLSEAWREHWTARRIVSQMRARDRYLWFLETHPGLIDEVPNKYVASLLGMTPVTLSRLRGELRDEQEG